MNQEKIRDVFDRTIKANRHREQSRSRRRVFGAIVALLFVAVGLQPAVAESIRYPSGSGLINVTDAAYGAVPNDNVDDTAAIQTAMNAARGRFKGRTVYFPNGTYLVSDRLVMTDSSDDHNSMTLQGQSQAGTIIKLVNNAVGFTNAAAPRAVLSTFEASPTSQRDFQNSGFSINIFNLTVDVGAGNTGAIGITYIANNQASIRDVTIKSSDASRRGVIGLDLTQRYAGPALVKRVTVIGFDHGVKATYSIYSMVFEDLTVREQRTVGIYNQSQMLTLRKLTSENTVPAIRQTTGGETRGMTVIIDSNLTGGVSTNPAIDIQDGFLFARNVQTSGYAAAIKNGATLIPGNNVAEWKTGATARAFDSSPETSMDLPIRETPEVPWDNPANVCTPALVPCAAGTWASVVDFGAVQGDSTSDRTAIQAAMDSGATTVYFPNTNGGSYRIGGTLTVGGNVRRVIGMGADILPSVAFASDGGAVFKFVNGNQPVVMLENIRSNYYQSKIWFVEQASSKTLVLRNIGLRRAYAYRNTGYGDVFIEDFNTIPSDSETTPEPCFVFKNQRVWARQINPEQVHPRIGAPQIVNDGATVWMLGLKTEQNATLAETKNGGRTEILGGLTLISNADVAAGPAFINNNSHVSIVHIESRDSSAVSIFPTVVEETRAGVTRQLLNTNTQLLSRKARKDISQSYVVPLYTGYVNAVVPADFNGDGKTDVSVYRPAAAAVWHLLASGSSNAYSSVQFGTSGDKLAPADFDGDGRTDIALYRPSNGTWYAQQTTAGFRAVGWGVAEDKPVPADYDGDGKADYAVYRPSTGAWFIYRSSDNTVAIQQFGVAEDVPTVGDYDGDGRADMAVWRPSTGVWYMMRSAQGFAAATFGLSSDKPVAADYDGDGKTDIAVWRPSSGTWYMEKSAEGFGTAQFGVSTDVPTPGDYDGDGRSDLAVWRPASAVWFVQQSRDGFLTRQFGVATDKAVPAAYVR